METEGGEIEIAVKRFEYKQCEPRPFVQLLLTPLYIWLKVLLLLNSM